MIKVNDEIIDITPQDSVAKIFLVPITNEELLERQEIQNKIDKELEDNKNKELEQELIRQSAIEKLAKLGLTEEEAKAVIGI